MKAFSTLAIMEASVSPHVSHDMLNDGIVEARAYQLEAVEFWQLFELLPDLTHLVILLCTPAVSPLLLFA